MAAEIQAYCLETGQEVPETLEQMAAVIYNSLAECYKKTIEEIEEISNKNYHSIHIVGGGSNADYFNQQIARITKRKVLAGPSEAAAAGNLLIQMITDGQFAGLAEARNCMQESFGIQAY